MAQDNKHRALLNFIKKVVDVPLGYSKEDLVNFRSLAFRECSFVVPLIDEYLKLAEKSDSDVRLRSETNSKASRDSISKRSPADMHLFDLLRERRLFPSNSDLSQFAANVLPNMSRHRFDKMSRGDIAARIIEYLETRDPRTRQHLEASMRDALTSPPDRPANRKSFLSKWERIIKGIEL